LYYHFSKNRLLLQKIAIKKKLSIKFKIMRKFHKFILPMVLFLLVFAVSSTAQENKTKQKSNFERYFYINGNVGFTNFYGDMHPKRVLGGDEQFGYGFKAGYQFSPVFGARLSFVNGIYQSTYDPENIKNINDYPNEVDLEDKLQSSMWDASAQLTIDITNIFRQNKEAGFGIYGFAGVGWLNYSSMRTKLDNGSISIDSEGNEFRNGTYSDNQGSGISGAETAITIPTGLGMYFSVSPKVDLNLESSLRFTDTDIIDMREGGAMAVKNDFYGYTSLGITYKFKPSSGLKTMKKRCDEVIYEVDPEVLEVVGDKVSFTINITYPEKYFGKSSALRFAPYLKYGDQMKELPAKFFKGEKLQGDGDLVPYATGGTFVYSTTFDYTPDMANSELYVYPWGFDPNEPVDAALTNEEIVSKYKNLDMCETKLADGIRNTGALAGGNENTLYGEHGYELETILSKATVLYYPKNKFKYSERFGQNKTEMSKQNRENVNAFLAQGWDIKGISINAYASPEGEETFNANLSENRGITASDYIKKEINNLIKAEDSKLVLESADDVAINAVGNGPDWNGFMSALQSSNIEDKNTMLNVIRSASPEKKEEEIRNMILIYPELEDDILSPLRRAEIVVSSFEPKRSAEEISRLATTDPSQLTTEELLYAATLTKDENAKKAIYTSAAELHANSWVAQNNAAVVAMNAKDYNVAKTFLDNANKISPNNAVVINNYGVYYAKQENWAKAEEYFNNAKKMGKNANYNLGVVAIHNGEYAKALQLFGNQKCDFNVALAQTLLEKYDEANTNLDCAKETCKTNYLQAVIAARQDKDEMVFTKLARSFELNGDMKNRAANDREFIKYFNNEEFINLVK
jgi:Tfp pilus assembly protein PilF